MTEQPGQPEQREQREQPEQRPEVRELWAEVGEHLSELGRAVRGHLEPESPDSASWSPPPDGGYEDRPGDRWSETRDTVRRLGRTAQQLAAQAGEAARDPVVRESAQQAARSFGAAVTRVAEDLRDNARSPRWSDPEHPRPTPPVTPVRTDDDPA